MDRARPHPSRLVNRDASGTGADDPRTALVLALSTLSGMGPRRLGAALDHFGAERAWARLRGGTAGSRDVAAALGVPEAVASGWAAAVASLDPVALLRRHNDAGVAVLTRDDPDYPRALTEDPAPPELLFRLGDPTNALGRRVAIVGTRRATRYGVELAVRLGSELSGAGIHVVSGLALGIDGAAHEGSLRADGGAAPIGVVGSGLDVCYPARHRRLWSAVAERGVLYSEAPLGSPPEAWRFPARNRIIAGLVEAVIVVESGEAGGSMLTVDEALLRDRTVFAVPGPVTSRTSAGTNRLLADGAVPLLDAADVLDLLGPGREEPTQGERSRPTAIRPRAGGRRPTTPGNPSLSLDRSAEPLDADQAAVLDAMGWEPCGLDELADRLPAYLTPEALAVALVHLEAQGRVEPRGPWWERVP